MIKCKVRRKRFSLQGLADSEKEEMKPFGTRKKKISLRTIAAFSPFRDVPMTKQNRVWVKEPKIFFDNETIFCHLVQPKILKDS